MSFTFNNLNGSPKSNATVARSTNSPSKSNLNTDDIVKNSGDKSNKLNIESTAVSKSESDINSLPSSSLFVFGNPKKISEPEAFKGFNFVLNSNCFDQSASSSNAESKVVGLSSVNLSVNNLFDKKENMEPKLEDKTKVELDSDNNNENSTRDEDSNNQEQRQEQSASNNEEMLSMVVKTMVKEFKDVVSSFVKERTEGERKMAAMEGRINALEEEIKNMDALKDELKNIKKSIAEKSSTVNPTRNDGATKSTENSVSQQPLEQPPTFAQRQIPSPLVSLPVESSSLKKSTFGSSSSIFSGSNTPLFNGSSTNFFGSTASSLLGTDNNVLPTTVSSNFTLGSSMFTSNAPTQVQNGSQLFGASAQNQNGKNLVPEQKKSKKLFSHEAVTDFLNAQKDPGMNNHSTKASNGNPLKKMANGHESSEQNQTMTKEAFESHLQRTIEMSVKKVMEECWENFKSNAPTTDNFKKFNPANMF